MHAIPPVALVAAAPQPIDPNWVQIHGPCAAPNAACAIRIVFDANNDAMKAVLESQQQNGKDMHSKNMHYEVDAQRSARQSGQSAESDSASDNPPTVSLIVPVHTGDRS
jgi:hypothetical protein